MAVRLRRVGSDRVAASLERTAWLQVPRQNPLSVVAGRFPRSRRPSKHCPVAAVAETVASGEIAGGRDLRDPGDGGAQRCRPQSGADSVAIFDGKTIYCVASDDVRHGEGKSEQHHAKGRSCGPSACPPKLMASSLGKATHSRGYPDGQSDKSQYQQQSEK